MKDMTPLQEHLQMAKRTGQRSFDYAMNACEEANKLTIALQRAYDEEKDRIVVNGLPATEIAKTHAKAIAEKHDRLMEKKGIILEAAQMISDALDKLYGIDMSEFF